MNGFQDLGHSLYYVNSFQEAHNLFYWNKCDGAESMLTQEFRGSAGSVFTPLPTHCVTFQLDPVSSFSKKKNIYQNLCHRVAMRIK